jgi:hypothetical protein
MARQGNQRNRERERIGSSEGTNHESTRPSEDRIRQRAYERYQERGGEHGRDTDDWFEAERDVEGERGPRSHDQRLPQREGESIESMVNSEHNQDRERNTP